MARPVTAWGSLPFAEQIAFFNGKVDMPTQSWLDLLGAGHDRAFVVAGAMKADLLADLHAAVLKAIEQGTTLDTFRKDFNSIVAKRGWTGWTGEDTPGGRAWRQEIIYGTNMRTSYQAGRHAQAVAIAHRRPYWRWRHADTVAHPRPLHVAWDGKILRYDNPWWQAHWPPAGWNSLLPWERVHGHISLGLKARYSGQIVEIIGDSGGRLCLTSQHPVLTDKGWIAAGDIKEGCNLLRYRFDVDGGAMASCSYDNQPPPRADEIFDTLGLHGNCTMPRAAFNLYGDVKFFNSDVDVVGANRELLEDVKAESAKFRSKIAFMLSDKEIVGKSGIGRFSLSSLQNLARSVSSKVAHGLHAFTETSFSFALDKHGASIEFNPTLFQMRRQILSADVESCGQLAQGNAGEILVSKVVRDRFSWFNRSLPLPLGKLLKKLFIFGPGSDSPQFEISAKRGSPYSIFLGNLIDRFTKFVGFRGRLNFLFGQYLSSSSRMVPGIVGYFGKSYFTAGPYRDASIYQSPSYAGGTNPNAFRDVMDAQSSLIEFDRVSKVVVSHYSGPVYDFQTKNGLIISYGGFCVSNCRCRVETLAERDLERLGKSGPDPTPDDGTYEWLDKAGNSHTIPNGVDPGWDYTPGATRDLIAEVKAKAAGLPEVMGNVFMEDMLSLLEKLIEDVNKNPSENT